LEEYEGENKDLKKPTLFGMLDAKSAFDVVLHSHLVRKLYHMGISKQAIHMIDNLYKNAVSKINWKGQSSEPFPINQGVRQGGTSSADLYKVYINQFLNILVDSQLGGKIESICCCADDIALASDILIDLQVLVNIAYDYSQREGYMLQPQKSLILPVNTCNRISFDEEEWFMNDNIMPVTTTTPHIGIQRDSKNTSLNTIENNLKKSRQALYSLMQTGLHIENGLNPIYTA
jgi:hypothetical protein